MLVEVPGKTHDALAVGSARSNPRVRQYRERLSQLDLVHLDKVQPDHPLRLLLPVRLGRERTPVQRFLEQGAGAASAVRGRERAVRADQLAEEDVEPVERLGRVRREVVGERFEQSRGVGGGSGCVRRSTRGLVQTQ